jgi:transcriptional regulator with XRE-family HTH domain
MYDKMLSVMDMDFSDWLLQEMNKRGWSQADLARNSGLNRQSVSDYVNRRRTNPDPEALVSIAKGLKISPITIFRIAGLLPEGGEKASFEDWQYRSR